jgi:hypothetical protein
MSLKCVYTPTERTGKSRSCKISANGSDEENVWIFAARFLLTFNDSFSIFSIASVDINKIMVVFYHLLVCPWISVENIILTLTNFFISFLAHLWWAIAMTWHPSSSVCKARFVTTRDISMKLGVRIPWGNTPRSFFNFRDSTYFVASRRPSWKSDFCHLRANGCSEIYQIFFGGVSSKTTSHITRVLDLT